MTTVIHREGWDKNIPSYTGGWGVVEDAKFSKNFFQESKRRCKGYFVVDHLILRAGGADIKCRGTLFISSMGQGQERFQISLYEKHRVALLTPDQKVADSILAVRRTMCECSIDLACKTPLAAQLREYQV